MEEEHLVARGKDIDGKYFIDFQGDKVVRVGAVLGQVSEGYWLVQLYDVMRDGHMTCQKVVTVTEIMRYEFFETHEEWIKRGEELNKRVIQDPKDSR